MKLTIPQFEKRLADGNLAISLIGMSNAGKTFWGKKLAEVGFQHWTCDQVIEDELGSELKALGYQGIADVAQWMGQPYEARSAKNQALYLGHEIEAMKSMLDRLGKNERQNWAIDTTGSVIYTGHTIASELQEKTLTVWIQTTPAMQAEMFEKFLQHPKPIIWGESYQPRAGETSQETLKRCYPELLEYRTRLYARYADVVIPHLFLDESITGNTILERIKTHL